MMKTFKIYPYDDKTGLYFIVHVFKTKKDMIERIRRDVENSRYGRDTEALCQSFIIENHKNGRVIRSKNIGNIYFHGSPNSATVSHECVHAAFFWLRRMSGEDTINLELRNYPRSLRESDPEEMICEATGNFFRHCNLGLHDCGAWE